MIPEWNSLSVIPPIRPHSPGHSHERSPYAASLSSFVSRFATSRPRRTILQGFLKYRAALHSLGLVNGFQWVNGSFTEHVESIEGRDPNDIDVVTFFHIPKGLDQQGLRSKAGSLFDPLYAKRNFSVDSYLQLLDGALSPQRVRQITYWYSMWSHRRDGLWKGFLQIDLDSQQDLGVEDLLASLDE